MVSYKMTQLCHILRVGYIRLDFDQLLLRETIFHIQGSSFLHAESWHLF